MRVHVRVRATTVALIRPLSHSVSPFLFLKRMRPFVEFSERYFLWTKSTHNTLNMINRATNKLHTDRFAVFQVHHTHVNCFEYVHKLEIHPKSVEMVLSFGRARQH